MKSAIHTLELNYKSFFREAMLSRQFKQWDVAFKYMTYAKEARKAINILFRAEWQIQDMKGVKRASF